MSLCHIKDGSAGPLGQAAWEEERVTGGLWSLEGKPEVPGQ